MKPYPTFDTSRFVFILGVCNRSGTNYLQDLLEVHPDCRRSMVHEDHMARYSQPLEDYVKRLVSHYPKTWNITPPDIWRAVGDGLARMLCGDEAKADSHRKIVCKTPSPFGVGKLPLMFPGCRVVFIVRDGRDVVDSYLKSWKVTFHYASKRWIEGARKINEIRRNAPPGLVWEALRYEDLLERNEFVMRKLLDFLGLDQAKYDFARAANIPVKGSSTFGRQPGTELQWRVTFPKTPEFSPIGRWKNWPDEQKAEFHRLAEAELRSFGYQV